MNSSVILPLPLGDIHHPKIDYNSGAYILVNFKMETLA